MGAPGEWGSYGTGEEGVAGRPGPRAQVSSLRARDRRSFSINT